MDGIRATEAFVQAAKYTAEHQPEQKSQERRGSGSDEGSSPDQGRGPNETS